jgi:hypothetical protein
MARLISEPGALAGRIDRVRSALGDRVARQPVDIDIRVAASVTHLGLVARLLAPALGLAALGVSARPDILETQWNIDNLWWRNELGGPYPLSVALEPVTTGDSAVEAITIGIVERYPVSPKVLWGNIGSAINSATQMISRARPDLERAASRAAAALLTDPRIDGGQLSVGPDYRRRSCCLIYRIANGNKEICGDCVLRSGRD